MDDERHGDINKDLINAVIHRDINAMKKALSLGADIGTNPRFGDCDGMAPLMIAGRNGDMDAVRFLLEKGAGINETQHTNNSSAGTTALMFAILEGHEEVALYLLKNGADSDRGNWYLNGTMAAASKGMAPLVEGMIRAGCDINKRGSLGRTPIMFACESGDINTVKVIIDNGADIHALNDSGHTALMYGARSGNIDIIRLLVGKGADIRAESKYGTTPLGQASRSGSLRCLKYLLEQGASDDAGDDIWHSLLIQAGSVDVARFLVEEKGAPVNKQKGFVSTPLISAVIKGLPDLVEYLCYKRTQVNYREPESHGGKTALICAADNEYPDIVRYLITKKADPESKCTYGRTAVEYAVMKKNREIIEHAYDIRKNSTGGNPHSVLCAPDAGVFLRKFEPVGSGQSFF